MTKKNCQHQGRSSKKAIWTRWIVCGLLLLTAAADFISFAVKPEYWDFDMSPLVLLTNNIVIIFLVKFVVIGALIYLLFKAKEAKDHWKFLWILMAVYLIFAQTMGTISNRRVAEAAPPPEQAPSKEVRLEANRNFAWMFAYYPMIFAIVGFKLWEWGWRDG